MKGIVGNLLIKYSIENKTYCDTVNMIYQKEFSLTGCPAIKFTIDEITYIEDTIYGVEISFEDEDWYVSGNEPTTFQIEKYNISGTIELSFLN